MHFMNAPNCYELMNIEYENRQPADSLLLLSPICHVIAVCIKALHIIICFLYCVSSVAVLFDGGTSYPARLDTEHGRTED
jgi:hypothetical protein